MKARRPWILLPLILCAIGICLAPFVACPLALQFACRPIFIIPPVDASALAQAEFNASPARMEDFLDVSLFHSHEVIDRPDAGGVRFFHAQMNDWTDGSLPAWPRIEVHITLQASLSMARREFTALCPANDDSDSYERVFLQGGSGDNRYCVFYMEEWRNAPDSGCGATGQYDNHVMFQKGRAVLTVYEYTDDRESAAMNEALALLAEAISRKAQGP
jgi:hypothetical protein